MPYLDTLNAKFAGAFTTSAFRDNVRVLIDAERAPAVLFPLLKCLKDECGFDFLADVGAASTTWTTRTRPTATASCTA